MESAVEEIMDKLTSGTETEARKYSEGLSLGDKKSTKGLHRKQTISALRKRNQTYKERKRTMKVDFDLILHDLEIVQFI